MTRSTSLVDVLVGPHDRISNVSPTLIVFEVDPRLVWVSPTGLSSEPVGKAIQRWYDKHDVPVFRWSLKTLCDNYFSTLYLGYKGTEHVIRETVTVILTLHFPKIIIILPLRSKQSRTRFPFLPFLPLSGLVCRPPRPTADRPVDVGSTGQGPPVDVLCGLRSDIVHTIISHLDLSN